MRGVGKEMYVAERSEYRVRGSLLLRQRSSRFVGRMPQYDSQTLLLHLHRRRSLEPSAQNTLRQRDRVLGVRRKHPNRGLLFQQYLRLVHNRAGKR